uniref:Uncharacterized protein n=1 Tax=virus sp. ctiha2 TaxID=2827299 RepID=A0A8S5RGI7_9VIRU|nr:MAG TPA: hypothetical protein [virus sp. ctiha2]DAE86354.1 MAG TPA: hypothetical protein [Caudoviricetes sp.]DAX13896.1 MAG TPA: hypothetical protein [Bacteriophage sp.]DAT48995.1 MAG TPA: hypothetical protein [Caudoviricetes sp.]DAX97734.1 MAG TPA: hypothetical protein [Caudoviricetes sp.]
MCIYTCNSLTKVTTDSYIRYGGVIMHIKNSEIYNLSYFNSVLL